MTHASRRLPRSRRHDDPRRRLSQPASRTCAGIPWTIDAIRLLNRAGFLVCVTTNQGGIGLGFFTEAFVLRLHDEMSATLAAAGARIDGWFYCPHHPLARRRRAAGRLRLPQAAAGHDSAGGRAVRRSICRGRSSSATSWPTSGWRRASARAASWCGPGYGETELRAAWRQRARRRLRRRGPDGRDVVDPRRKPATRERRMSDRRRTPVPADLSRVSARAPGRRRRPRRRRVHLRPDRSRVARSAGADPEVRLDRDRARRRGQRREQRRGARRAASTSSASVGARRRGRRGCCRRCRRRAKLDAASSASAGTSRRSRRASSPAASTPPSSRSCASIAPAGAGVAAVLARSKRALARAIRRADAVIVSDYGGGLDHAGAVAAGARGGAALEATAARARRFALRPDGLHRHDGVHAERIRSGGAARRPHQRRPRGARAGRPRAADAACVPRGARSRAAAAAWRSSRPASRPITFRSSARTGRRRHRRRRHRHRDVRAGARRRRDVRAKPRASPITPAGSSS